MKKTNPENVLRFHQQIKEDSNSNYNSWKHCYKAFKDINQDETLLALHLGFYLASWGMYRGSTAISTKDYTIHIGTVKLIKEYYSLRCDEKNEFSRENIPELLSLCEALKNHFYGFEYFSKGKFEKRKPTDTLVSKIIIGTLGCTPAFDKYFNLGVKSNNFKFYKISKKSFEQLCDFKEMNKKDFIQLQQDLLKINQVHYPIFKIIDNYFWLEGYKKEKK